MELWEDDLAGQIQNEYDPMIPNNYEAIVRQRKSEQDRARDEEVRCLHCVIHILPRHTLIYVCIYIHKMYINFMYCTQMYA